jgi:hypothetical protein
LGRALKQKAGAKVNWVEFIFQKGLPFTPPGRTVKVLYSSKARAAKFSIKSPFLGLSSFYHGFFKMQMEIFH